MERSLQVATGESVAFSYELAGVGSRFLAVFIDMVVQWCVALFAFIIFAALVAAAPGFARPWGGSKVVAGALLAGLIFAGFALFFGYFIAFEALWHGRTPGKRIVGIRVLRDGGFPLDATGAVVRNVVRIVEVALGFYAVSAVSALISPENKRLGDYAAGTIVVRDRLAESVAMPPSRTVGAVSDPLVQELGPRERDLVLRYAARRHSLGERSRLEVAARIATIVRPHLAARFEHLDDDELLLHVAGVLR